MIAQRVDDSPDGSPEGFETGARVLLFSALLVATAIVLLPGEIGSAFGGPPTTQVARWWLTGGLWLAALVALAPPRRRIAWPALAGLAVLLVLKAWLGMGSPAHGWRGTYEMLDEPPKAALFAWRYRTHTYRLDRRIEFDGRDFGLYFLNDAPRYGHKIDYTQTRDVSVPLRMSWRGVANLPAAAPLSAYVTARGRVRVLVNGVAVLVNDGPTVDQIATTLEPVPAGQLDLLVIYEKPAGVSPAITVRLSSPVTGDLDVGAFGAPGPPRWLTRFLPDPSTAIVMLATGLLAGLFLWAYGVRRPLGPWPRAIAPAAVLIVFGLLLGFSGISVIPRSHLTFHQWSGDDPLVYMSNARSVLLEGWLMPDGFGIGRGEPFYHYPFFGYVVGLAQFVIGEDHTVMQIVNGFFVAAVVPLCWWLGLRSRPWWAATAGTLALGWMVWRHFLPYAEFGYTDSIFTGLVFLTLLFCLRALTGPWWYGLAAGVACAMAAGTRPSFLTFTPLFLAAVVLWRNGVARGVRLKIAALVLVGFIAGLAPFAARNYIMSGKFVVLVSSWVQVPHFMIPPEVQPNPVDQMFAGFKKAPTFGQALAAAAKVFAGDPVGVLRLELRKIAFTFGMTHWGMPGGSVFHPEFIVLSALFGLVLLRRALPADLLLVVVVFAVSHVAAMVISVPWTYGYKTILPLHTIFLLSAVYLLPEGRPRASG